MQVELYKKLVGYQDKDGNDKTATNFYVKCNDQLIPIDIKFFPDKATGKDSAYSSRKAVMGAFAEELPDKSNVKASGKNKQTKAKEAESSDDDSDIPFH